MSGYQIAQLPWLLDANGRPVGVKLQDGREVLFPTFAADPYALNGDVTALMVPNGPSIGIPQGAGLKKWRRAEAERRDGVRNSRLAFLGDSTTRGFGSGGAGFTGANGLAKNFVTKLANLLNQYKAPASAHSIFGCGHSSPYSVFDTRVNLGAGWTGTPIGSAIGNWVFANSTNNNPMTFTPDGTVDTFKIWFAKNTTLATFDASIDGGAVTQGVGAGARDVGSVTLTAASVGTRTLSIARAAGTTGSCYIIGIEAYDSTRKQIEVFNWGWSGARIENFVVTTNPWDVLSVIPTYAPDLTCLMMTINDANNFTDLAAYKANMQKVIDACKITGDVILMSGVPSAVGVSTLANQQKYVDAVRDLADTNGLMFIDNWRRFGNYESMNTLGFYTDTIHPSSVGYSDLATSVYSTLALQI